MSSYILVFPHFGFWLSCMIKANICFIYRSIFFIYGKFWRLKTRYELTQQDLRLIHIGSSMISYTSAGYSIEKRTKVVLIYRRFFFQPRSRVISRSAVVQNSLLFFLRLSKSKWAADPPYISGIAAGTSSSSLDKGCGRCGGKGSPCTSSWKTPPSRSCLLLPP